MTNFTRSCALLIGMALSSVVFAQDSKKFHTNSGGELIFQFNEVKTDSQNLQGPMRFTAFFHAGQYFHYDFNNNIGIYSGLGIRNVGMITDERINEKDYKIIRRVYTIGVPLALKIGSFKDHFHVFAGGEYEMAFHYKTKSWNSHSRSGDKTKNSQWFGNQTQRFMPSAFAGIQFPGGVNLKFKYYLEDFLNHSYKNDNVLRDLTRYEESQVFYFSLTWIFPDDMFGITPPPAEATPRAFIDM